MKRFPIFGCGLFLPVALLALTTRVFDSKTDESPRIVDLGPNDLTHGLVYDMNNTRQMVGTVHIGSTAHGFTREWSETLATQKTLLPLRDARSVNNRGQIAGSIESAGVHCAAIFNTEGSVQKIGALGIHSLGLDVNDDGNLVGMYISNGFTLRSFLWTSEAGIEDLNDLIGVRLLIANAISNSIEIVGTVANSTHQQAFRWSRDAGMTVLDAVPGMSAAANDVNNNGLVVGHFQTGTGIHGCLWDANNRFVDLNTLLPEDCDWELLQARAVNDHGEILCYGSCRGEDRTCLLFLDGAGDNVVGIRGVHDR